MKILLDECLPLDFRQSFHDHEAHTAQWAGLKGKSDKPPPQGGGSGNGL